MLNLYIRWVLAVDSTIANLTSHPLPRPDLTFVAAFDGTTLQLVSEHLACFDGGNIILGGLVLDRQDYINYGLTLVDGCHDTYNSTATGIGPEVFAWDAAGVPADQAAFYNASGFYITDSVYDLRPEVLESYYYAYRATGDSKYQDWSWEGIQAINASTRTGSGFSLISDVNEVGGGDKLDLQESFLFAEVLKYAYLIQAPVSSALLSSYSSRLLLSFPGVKHCRLTVVDTGCSLSGSERRSELVRVQYGSASFQGGWDSYLRISL